MADNKGSRGDGDFEDVVIAECSDRSEGVLLAGLLESEGIPCFVRGNDTPGIMGYSTCMSPIALVVPSNLAERAMEIIEEARNRGASALPSPDDPGYEDKLDSAADFFREDGEPESPDSGDEDEDEEPGPEASDYNMSSSSEGVSAPAKRPSIPVAIFLSFIPSLGMGHKHAGAHIRSLILACLEIFVLAMAYTRDSLEWLMAVPIIMLIDALGASLHISKQLPPQT